MSVVKLFINFFVLLLVSSWVFAEEPKSPVEFVAGLDSKEGFFDFHYQPKDGKLYLQIAQSQLDSPFLFQSSLPRGVGSNDIGLDRGQLGETRLVQFERFGGNVLLKQLNTHYRASSDNPAEKQAVTEAFASSVLAGLKIVSESETTLLVDYTDFLLSDKHRIGERLDGRKEGKYKVDAQRSGVYLPRSKAFPDNTELEALVTFVGAGAGQYVKQVSPSYESISVHLHHSLIRLPDAQYQTRAFHPGSGFWSVAYQDYATAIDEPLVQRFIPRHRLEKVNPGARLSKAKDPIIYYLDPGVPEPVRSALIDGAMWWNTAFEAIGFRDAFQVMDLPAGADPMDVRYNTIQWVHRATRGWSYGYSVIDPRTGEILKGHVTLGSLRVRQDLLIALGLTSPFDGANSSGKSEDISAQKAMALARIRQLSAHEVGHTLGIAHNFAASENDRASVMDYPHPKIAMNDGKISLDDAYDVGIGEWDKHAIAYGYQQFDMPEAEAQGLLEIVKRAEDKGLDYISDPDARRATSASEKGHLWDNGADPIAEFQTLLSIRKTALANFGLNSIADGTPLSQLEENVVPIYLMHRYQLDAMAKLVGGVSYHYELKAQGQQPDGLNAVDGKRQKLALDALVTSLRHENLSLSEELLALIVPQAYGFSRTREAFKGDTGPIFDPVSAAESLSAYIVNLILEPARLNRLSNQSLTGFGTATLIERLLNGSVNKAWRSDIQKRVNHVVLDALVQSLENPALGVESKGIIFAALIELVAEAKEADLSGAQALLFWWLETYLDEGVWKGKLDTAPLPPGSPI